MAPTCAAMDREERRRIRPKKRRERERERERERDSTAVENTKMPTASGVPRRSPIQVLTRPNVA